MKKEKCPVCHTDNVLVEDLKIDDKNTKSYLCIRCGYTTNSEYTTNSKIMKEMTSNKNNYSHNLFNLHIYDEETGLYWFPMVFMTKHGSVFPEGTHDNFKWCYIPIVDIKEDERTEQNKEFNQRFAVDLKETFKKEEFLIACKKLGAVDPKLEVS